MKRHEVMREKFYIAVAKFTNGERIALTFDTAKEADNYYAEFVEDIVRWTLVHHEFGKATLIHDCTGGGYSKLEQ